MAAEGLRLTAEQRDEIRSIHQPRRSPTRWYAWA